MGENLHRLFLSVGLVLYIFDLVSDIYVAVQHWNNDEPWWFGLTVGFICVPSFIVNFAAVIQICSIWTCMTAILQLSIVGRYLEAIAEPNTDVDEFSRTYLLAILRYVEAMTESAPQWCLQVYIMFRQQSFPLYTVVATVISMLSLTWSIMALEYERRKENALNFKCMKAFVFLIWQLSTLILRLLAIVMFAYVFRNDVIIPLAAHLLIVMLTIFLREICVGGGAVVKSFFLSMLVAFSSLVHPAEFVPLERAIFGMRFAYVFHILTTIFMYALSYEALERNFYNLSVLFAFYLIPLTISLQTILPIYYFLTQTRFASYVHD